MSVFGVHDSFIRKLLIFSLISCSAVSFSCLNVKANSENVNMTSADASFDNSKISENTIEHSIGDLYFLLDSKSSEAKFLRSTSSNVIIPKSVDYGGKSYSVTSIADNAFVNRTDLVSVSIPNSVKSIGSKAFYGCWRFNNISIPESVEKIGDYAFWNCSAPTTIEIQGNNLKSIGDGAFADCYSMKVISIPETVVSIGENAFKNCRSLSSIQISGNFDRHKFDNSEINLKKDINQNYTENYSVEGTSVEGVLMCKNSTSMNCFCSSGNEAIAIDLIVNKWGGNCNAI